MRSAVGPVLAPPSASAPWFASLDVNALPSECILRQVPLAISDVYSTIYCDWDRWCKHMCCKHTDICWCSCSFETKWGSSPKQAVPISLSLPLEDATETNQEFPFYKITDLQNPWPKCSFLASRKLAVQPSNPTFSDISVMTNMANLYIETENVNLRYRQHEGVRNKCVRRTGASRLFLFIFEGPTL